MILVTGANGFIGQKVMESCPDTVAAPSLRNASAEEIRRIVAESGADTVLHTAAISDTGFCQANPDASYLANVQIPVFLAEACREKKLICFSSDQVYNASPEEGSYTEDQANPGSIYGQHKLEMEQRVLDILPSSVMLRAEWMYDYYLPRANFFMNMLHAQGEISLSFRQYRGLAYRKEVIRNIEQVIRLPGGTYNFGSETTQTMQEITEFALKALGKKVTLRDIPSRHNLWMNCAKAKKHGVQFSTVTDALRLCMQDNGLL